jgi:hypothetical protein
MNDAISYIKNSNDTLAQKVAYLHSLKSNQYRYGRKYKYECNLNEGQIGFIIRNSENENLFLAYYGKTKKEADKNQMCTIVVVLSVLAIIYILFIISAIIK